MNHAPGMRLKEIETIVPVAVVRDSLFQTLGFLSDPQAGMLVFLGSPDYLGQLRETPEASCVLTTEALAAELPSIPGLAVGADPRRSFFELHNHLASRTQFYGSGHATEVHPTARIHPRAFVADRNVCIGAHTVIGPNATVMERCTIGASVTVWPGAVLGSAGFQTARCGGEFVDMLHAGGIRIHDRAEILSNAVIATAVFRQATTVGEDARIGNLAFLSHNVQVGPRSFIGHGATVNGNVRIGADAWVGPGATLSNNITLADGATVSLGATVSRDVSAGRRVTGMLAIDHAIMLRHLASLK
jgi:UDP-3-O-[3-hydroxymyristoyl] glucosamine N-acyltransferase